MVAVEVEGLGYERHDVGKIAEVCDRGQVQTFKRDVRQDDQSLRNSTWKALQDPGGAQQALPRERPPSCTT